MYLAKKVCRLRAAALPDALGASSASPSQVGLPAGHNSLVKHLSIPCPAPTDEDVERDKHRLRGQFLARQDRWTELTEEVAQADQINSITSAAMSVAELLCFGARADVVMAVEQALSDGRTEQDAPVNAGIRALEEMFEEDPQNPVRGIIVACAHMDIGWAWRGLELPRELSWKQLDLFGHHFDRAREILSQFEENCKDSALFCSAACSLNASGIAPGTRLAKEYGHLIDLQPRTPAPMRALGTYLSPRWYGNHKELEIEARRTASRTQKVWGTGGYTWVLFDTLPSDPFACEHIDAELFIQGLRDILERLPDQHTANLLAAFCAVSMGCHGFDHKPGEDAREQIAASADWIVRSHLTELHPLIWAHAAKGFENSLQVPSARKFAANGRQSGEQLIAAIFSNEIKDGKRIVFSADGPAVEPRQE